MAAGNGQATTEVPTTVANTQRVLTYSTFATGAVYMADKRLEWGLDNIETAFLTVTLTALCAFLWNGLKDLNYRFTPKDNR